MHVADGDTWIQPRNSEISRLIQTDDNRTEHSTRARELNEPGRPNRNLRRQYSSEVVQGRQGASRRPETPASFINRTHSHNSQGGGKGRERQGDQRMRALPGRNQHRKVHSLFTGTYLSWPPIRSHGGVVSRGRARSKLNHISHTKITGTARGFPQARENKKKLRIVRFADRKKRQSLSPSRPYTCVRSMGFFDAPLFRGATLLFQRRTCIASTQNRMGVIRRWILLLLFVITRRRTRGTLRLRGAKSPVVAGPTRTRVPKAVYGSSASKTLEKRRQWAGRWDAPPTFNNRNHLSPWSNDEVSGFVVRGSRGAYMNCCLRQLALFQRRERQVLQKGSRGDLARLPPRISGGRPPENSMVTRAERAQSPALGRSRVVCSKGGGICLCVRLSLDLQCPDP